MNPLPSSTGLFLSRLIYYAVPFLIAYHVAGWLSAWWPYAVLAMLFIAVALISRNQKLTNGLRFTCRRGYPQEVVESLGFWELLWCRKALRYKIGILDCWFTPIYTFAVFGIFYVGSKDPMFALTFSVFAAPFGEPFNALGPRRTYHSFSDGEDQDNNGDCGAPVPTKPRTPTLIGRN